MQFLRRHWYNIGGIVAIGALVYLVVSWSSMPVLQRLLLLNFIAILVHQFEEYGWPGGEPAIMNMVLQPSDTPDRFPLNQNSAMVVNVLIAYPVYLIPVFLPNVIWLGLAPLLMGMAQFVVHGIQTNRKLHSWYNPGLAAVVLLHIPIGIVYIVYIQTHGLASGWDWLFAILYLAFIVIVGLRLMTYNWLADRNSPYVFDAVEMRRFNVPAKLARLKA